MCFCLKENENHGRNSQNLSVAGGLGCWLQPSVHEKSSEKGRGKETLARTTGTSAVRMFSLFGMQRLYRCSDAACGTYEVASASGKINPEKKRNVERSSRDILAPSSYLARTHAY
jgi:hypothetical protein